VAPLTKRAQEQIKPKGQRDMVYATEWYVRDGNGNKLFVSAKGQTELDLIDAVDAAIEAFRKGRPMDLIETPRYECFYEGHAERAESAERTLH